MLIINIAENIVPKMGFAENNCRKSALLAESFRLFFRLSALFSALIRGILITVPIAGCSH